MADRPLEGKVALVTGAGSPIGFGRRMTFALTAAGARVAMMDVSEEWVNRTADEVRAEAGQDSVLPIVESVSSWESAARAVNTAISDLGGLDILVNNAGTNPRNVGLTSEFREKCWEVSPEAWLRVFGVNCAGPFFMVRAAVGHMMEKGWGRIIGVTTSLDTMYRAHGSPYGPSKAGHEAFMATLCQELEGTGVTANVLVPGGPANTNLIPQEAPYDRNQLIQPPVMEKPVVWLASEASDGINGRRFIAYHWDESLPLEERLSKASAPCAWPQAGQAAIAPGR